MDSELINKAIVFATQKHKNQYRRGSGLPYILHPLEVGVIISTLTHDENTICAGILHDTIEDTDTTFDELLAEFGPRVAKLVQEDSEDKRPGIPESHTWQIRKEESLAKLSATNDEAIRIMWMGDKLSNLRSLYISFLEKGDKLWENFNQKDPQKQAWLFGKIGEQLSCFEGTLAYSEYMDLYQKIFGEELWKQ